jgi:hypothetical protein
MSRKHFKTSLDVELLQATKKLAVDLDCTVNDLLEEGKFGLNCQRTP